ncbi:MAG: response regulator [Planctomycetaceae bacterium]
MAVQVLSVGQCDYDHSAISRLLAQRFQATVQPAHTASEALQLVAGQRFDLVLINRLLDWDGSEGLEVLRQIRARDGVAAPPVMLVSNLAEAQAASIAAGGVPGFGKNALHAPQTLELLQPYLAPAAS